MLERRSEQLDHDRVVQSFRLMLSINFSLRDVPREERLCRIWGDSVSRFILKTGLGDANTLMGFVRRLDPALLAEVRRRGLKTVGDQMIAPAMIEEEESTAQQDRWPGWQKPSTAHRFVIDYEARTWEHLDHLTCASDYVRNGLIRCGVEPGQISVLPYPIDSKEFDFVDRTARSAPLTVGFVGSVNLRKGAPYFVEAAKHFDPEKVRFVMVGPVQLDRPALAKQLHAVELVGSVPRSEVKRWLQKFDLFFFPSTCEGSAGSVMEAMASGLPVITTPNSGSVVRDGIDGYVVNYNDQASMVARLGELIDDADRRSRFAQSARQRVEQFNVDGYANQIAGVLTRVMTNR